MLQKTGGYNIFGVISVFLLKSYMPGTLGGGTWHIIPSDPDLRISIILILWDIKINWAQPSFPSLYNPMSSIFFSLSSILILVPSPFGVATSFLGRALMLSLLPFRYTVFKQLLQWKLLNVVTLRQTESDNINQMITISNLLLIQLT